MERQKVEGEIEGLCEGKGLKTTTENCHKRNKTKEMRKEYELITMKNYLPLCIYIQY